MDIYHIFQRLEIITVIGGGIICILLVVLYAWTDSWTSPFMRFCSALIFFLLPASVLFRLLSTPLNSQSHFRIGGAVLLILLSLAVGAANAFRQMRAKHDVPRGT